MLCQLSYCPSSTEGLRPSDSLHRRSRGPRTRSAPAARFAALARAVPRRTTLLNMPLLSLHSANAAFSIAARPLLGFFVGGVLAAEAAELAEFEPLAGLLLVLGRAVVAPLTVLARQADDVSGIGIPDYSMISLMVPAPTVRPPSRIAKRAPFSSATGTCSSALMVVLSPGITISTPSGSFSEPVTSVVRM